MHRLRRRKPRRRPPERAQKPVPPPPCAAEVAPCGKSNPNRETLQREGPPLRCEPRHQHGSELTGYLRPPVAGACGGGQPGPPWLPVRGGDPDGEFLPVRRLCQPGGGFLPAAAGLRSFFFRNRGTRFSPRCRAAAPGGPDDRASPKSMPGHPEGRDRKCPRCTWFKRHRITCWLIPQLLDADPGLRGSRS